MNFSFCLETQKIVILISDHGKGMYGLQSRPIMKEDRRLTKLLHSHSPPCSSCTLNLTIQYAALQ